MENKYLKLFQKYRKEYYVNDLISKDNDYIFILGSPHNDELNEGYPISGNNEMTLYHIRCKNVYSLSVK